MIQEPARVQATTYEEAPQSNVTIAGERSYSSNCNCSLKRTERIVPTKASPMLTSTTTIPIVINTLPNPRIILIKVPQATHTSNCNSSNNKSNRTEQSAPRTRLIRIPFLPGSDPATDSVKRALPTAKTPVNYTTSATASRIANSTGTIYPLEQCSSSSNNSSHIKQVDLNDLMVGPPTTASTLNTMVTQTVQVSSTPLTLASMAGIQLTGADMQSSHQDMSGAMPTATVEEIDVPVFIDEYLQDIEASSSTSSSNYNNNNINKSEEIRTEICTETDRFDFDFDINLIAEDHIECKEMDQCNLGMDSIYSDNINDFNNMVNLLEVEEEETLDMRSMCNGIDIPICNPGDELDLGNILTSSENPMLSTFSQGSMLYSSSQTIKCFNELPMLGDENSMENSFFTASQLSLGFGDAGSGDVCHAVAMPDVTPTLCVGVKRTASVASIAAVETMPQKRSKLFLDINTTQNHLPDVINTPNIIEQLLNDEEPNLASNISTQDKIYEDLRSTEENTSFTILPDNFSAPNTPNSSTYSISTGRSHETTCQTGFAGFITAPVSPACSTASTSQFSVTTTTTEGSKRKRGRPAKEHADGPDPELMSQMTEEEAKLYRDRIKNNEASRVSRRKTKKREEEEMREENSLLATNEQLRAKLERLTRRSQMAIELLGQNYHKNSTYVKREPEH